MERGFRGEVKVTLSYLSKTGSNITYMGWYFEIDPILYAKTGK
jgi:hypothetical protein